MKKCLALLTVILAVTGAGGQSIPASQSRVAGRFVAYNYGLWNTYPASISPTTGSQTFTVINSYVNLGDGRLISPFSTNAPLRIGTETVTPSAVANCFVNDVRLGVCQITVTFALSHTNSDKISSATFGLQEALNDAGNSGGGPVTVDSAWAGAGGTTAMVSAAIIPAGASIEDVRNGTTTGSGTVSGQTSGKIPLATGATVVGAPSHLDDGLTTPATITATEPLAGSSAAFSGNVNANASIPSVSPHADIRWWGAVIDGATPVDTALTASVNVCNAANGNSCQVLLPCGGPNGCLIDNGSTALPAAPSGKIVVLDAQGSLHLNSTLVIPSNYMIKCNGGGVTPAAFQSLASCGIVGPAVKGAMGTATVTVGTPTTFTPTFTTGSISNFHVNSAISVAGVQTCTADASRDSTIAYHAPNTVLTVSTCTNSSGTTETVRMPVGTTVQITCPGDSSFNQNQTLVNGQDWPASTISVYEAGGTATTTGCTLVGYDDFSYETVRIDGVSGGVLTATFAHPHDASDVWGMVGVSTSNPAAGPRSNLSLEGVKLNGAYGQQLWLDNIATINMTGVAALPQAYMASGGVEADGAWWGQWNSVQFYGGTPFSTCTPGTVTNCTTPAYPFGLRCSQDSTRRNGIGCGQLGIRDATTIGGIKIDGNGMINSNGTLGAIILSNYIAEQSYEGMITVDNSHSLSGDVHIYADVLTQSDSFLQNKQHYFAATDCCLNNGYASIGALSFNGRTIKLSNKYWMGGVQIGSGVGGLQNNIPNPTATAPHTSAGILSDGNTLIANMRGSGANFSPSLIPFTTLPVTAAPTCATCIAVQGPDKVANSAIEVQTAAGPTNITLQVASASLATYPGDWIVYGAWIAPGALQTNVTPGSVNGVNAFLSLFTFGTDTFQGGISVYSPTGASSSMQSGVLLPMVNDTWQPGINVVTIITGQSTPHTIKLSVQSGSSAQGVGAGNRYWNWWWALIPGPNNPSYDGTTTRQEVMRYVRENVHGYVPPSVPSGGGILAINPSHKFFWEPGVNLYDAGGGVLKTDAIFNAVNGLQINGVPVTSAVPTTVPGWLQFLGDGSEGASTCSGAISGAGEHWYSSFTVNGGATCTFPVRSLAIRVTGTCTINGTIDASAVGIGNTSVPVYGGAGGGGGGGAASGAAGASSLAVNATGATTIASGGALGTAGSAGGNGNVVVATLQKTAFSQGMAGGYGWGGGAGGAGGSSGGAAGNGGEAITLTCGSIVLGANNLFDVSGGPGQPSTANSVGAGGGGGGGVVVLRSPSITGTPTINANGGPGGSCTVPMAQWSGGGGTGLTTTATVTTGAISACAVGGTTTGFNSAPKCTIVGGGGTLGTCHFTFSGGTVTGCVVDAGGSGYTQSTFTTCGAGGTGALGWSRTIAN